MRISDFITEAPISDFAYVGDWSKNSSFNTQDRKLLTNPKAVEKIKRQWVGTKNEFNMIFANHADARNVGGEIGKVSREWVEENFPRIHDQMTFHEGAINVIFVNNRGDERVPMTGWIIAHRLSHVLSRGDRHAFDEVSRYFEEYIGDVLGGYSENMRNAYNKRNNQRDQDADRFLKALYSSIGTMKSARNNNLRNSYEFYHELLAQYIITGKIKFNPFPEQLKVGRYNLQYKYHDLDYYDGNLEGLEEVLEDHFANVLNSMVGSIWVM